MDFIGPFGHSVCLKIQFWDLVCGYIGFYNKGKLKMSNIPRPDVSSFLNI